MSEAPSSATAELCERLDRLEAYATELARHFDESRRILGMYYRAYKELETVVDRLVLNQDRIVGHLKLDSPAQERGGEKKWQGTMCPHGRRPYRCTRVECAMRRAASKRVCGPVQNASAADDLTQNTAKTESRMRIQS